MSKTANLPAPTDTQVVIYEAKGGQKITLSLSIVKDFLVTGKKEFITEQEIVFFMGVCKARGLNPFAKDCYLVKYSQSDPAAIIVAIDFYRSRAKAQKDCTGWQKGVLCFNKKDGSVRDSNGLVLPTEELVGGWFEAQPVGWSAPQRLEVNLGGYSKDNAFWKGMKAATMIMKVAESQGLRTCWPDEFGGTLVAEEIGELSEGLTTMGELIPEPQGAIAQSEPDSKTIDFSTLKNFPAFDALVGPKIQDLHPEDQETRAQHLSLYLNKNTQAAAKQHKMPPAKAAEKVLDHFIARFEEIWGKFLTWENMPEHPWNQEQADKNRPWVDPKATVTEPGAEAGPAEKAEAETSGEDEGPATEGEGQAEEPFEARKNRVWGLVVKKYGSTKDMKANVGIARSADITEDNVDEIEEKVT